MLERALKARSLRLITAALSETKALKLKNHPDCEDLFHKASELEAALKTEEGRRTEKFDDALIAFQGVNEKSPLKRVKSARLQLTEAVEGLRSFNMNSPRVGEGEQQIETLDRLDAKIRAGHKNIVAELRQAIGDSENLRGLREAIEKCDLCEPDELDLSQLPIAKALLELRDATISKDVATCGLRLTSVTVCTTLHTKSREAG
jgi:hypothetical protein